MWMGGVGGGDLLVVAPEVKRVEVKCFAGAGPASFGHSRLWDELWWMDARRLVSESRVAIYKTAVPFESDTIRRIPVTRNETFGDQCMARRRPKLTFERFVEHVGEERIEMVYDGVWEELCH